MLRFQELLAPVFIGSQALLIGKSGLFLRFKCCVKAIFAVSKLQNSVFGLFLSVI